MYARMKICTYDRTHVRGVEEPIVLPLAVCSVRGEVLPGGPAAQNQHIRYILSGNGADLSILDICE